MASIFFPKPFVALAVAPIITGIIVHFRFHIRCIFVHKLLYLCLFSASLYTTFLSAGLLLLLLLLLILIFLSKAALWSVTLEVLTCYLTFL